MSAPMRRLAELAAEASERLARHPDFERSVRIAEAVLFATATPLTERELADRLPAAVETRAVLDRLGRIYAPRGVNLVAVAGGWAFRTAADLADAVAPDRPPPQKLSRAALEVLAIIAYHQPVTRAEIEDVRGVPAAKGTLDTLLESGWIRLRGRRRTPGRPVTYGTTPAFLAQFGLNSVGDLPGLAELRSLGFLEGAAAGLCVPAPRDEPALAADEDPLEDGPGEEARPEHADR